MGRLSPELFSTTSSFLAFRKSIGGSRGCDLCVRTLAEAADGPEGTKLDDLFLEEPSMTRMF